MRGGLRLEESCIVSYRILVAGAVSPKAVFTEQGGSSINRDKWDGKCNFEWFICWVWVNWAGEKEGVVDTVLQLPWLLAGTKMCWRCTLSWEHSAGLEASTETKCEGKMPRSPRMRKFNLRLHNWGVPAHTKYVRRPWLPIICSLWIERGEDMGWLGTCDNEGTCGEGWIQ